jgi:hypothetical protein
MKNYLKSGCCSALIFMPARFVNLDRQTSILLPYDLCECPNGDPIVFFTLDAVARTPAALFRVNRRGTGSNPHTPTMMLMLLIHCYATGQLGSRTINAAMHTTWQCVSSVPTIIRFMIQSACFARLTGRCFNRVLRRAASRLTTPAHSRWDGEHRKERR